MRIKKCPGISEGKKYVLVSVVSRSKKNPVSGVIVSKKNTLVLVGHYVSGNKNCPIISRSNIVPLHYCE